MYRMFFAVFLAIGVAADAHAGPLTYDIQSYLSEQNGWSLSGTITTDGNLGAITATDIISWEFTVTKGGSTYMHGLTLGGAYVEGTLLATATSLTLPIPVSPDTENALQLGNGFFEFPVLEWTRGSGGTPITYPAGDFYGSRMPGLFTFWSDNVPTGALPLPTVDEPFIIAGVPVATGVPEPSSLLLAGVGAAAFGFGAWIRRRKLVAA